MLINLKKLRTEHKLTQKEIAQKLGISVSAYSFWENGKFQPDNNSLIKLSEIFNCSTDYLLGNSTTTSSNTLSPDEAELLQLYATANKQAQISAKAILELGQNTSINHNIGNSTRSNTLTDSISNEVSYIRHYFVPAAAGYASPIEGEDYEMVVKTDKIPHNADFCVNIQGDSMEPYIHDGQTVYVQRDATLTDFDVGIFFVDGDVLCKQYCIDNMGTLYLLSANPQREDANRIISRGSSSTVACFGKVLVKRKLPKPKYY